MSILFIVLCIWTLEDELYSFLICQVQSNKTWLVLQLQPDSKTQRINHPLSKLDSVTLAIIDQHRLTESCRLLPHPAAPERCPHLPAPTTYKLSISTTWLFNGIRFDCSNWSQEKASLMAIMAKYHLESFSLVYFKACQCIFITAIWKKWHGLMSQLQGSQVEMHFLHVQWKKNFMKSNWFWALKHSGKYSDWCSCFSLKKKSHKHERLNILAAPPKWS